MKEFDPVLSIFQGEKPLAVFLYETFKAVFLSGLERIVRSEMLKYKLNQLFKIDYTLEKNLLPTSSVNVGFAATNSLKHLLKSTLQVSEVRKFRQQARNLMVAFILKILERSPLKYPLTLRISALSPIQIRTVSVEMLTKRFTRLMEILSDSKWITCTSAERALKQYKLLLAHSNLKCKFSEFSMNEHRLDEFYHDIFDQFNQPCEDLKAVIKLISILSHGNARMESGFSINKEILEVNLMK